MKTNAGYSTALDALGQCLATAFSDNRALPDIVLTYQSNWKNENVNTLVAFAASFADECSESTDKLRIELLAACTRIDETSQGRFLSLRHVLEELLPVPRLRRKSAECMPAASGVAERFILFEAAPVDARKLREQLQLHVANWRHKWCQAEQCLRQAVTSFKAEPVVCVNVVWQWHDSHLTTLDMLPGEFEVCEVVYKLCGVLVAVAADSGGECITGECYYPVCRHASGCWFVVNNKDNSQSYVKPSKLAVQGVQALVYTL